MAAQAHRRQGLPDAETRRRQIEDCLERHGLRRRARPVYGGEAAVRLRAALEELGPVFGAFGAYLGSRPDLLSTEDCLRLCGLEDAAPPMPTGLVRQRVAAEAGLSVDRAYAAFAEEPLECRRFFQTHRAGAHGGEGVLVSVLHPDVGDLLRLDSELLGLLGEAGTGIPWVAFAFGEALGDFRRSLDRQLDFRHQAEAVEALAQDARDFDLLQAPPVLRELCSSGLLTRLEPPGWRLDSLAAPLGADPGEGAEAGLLRQAQIQREDLARYFCLAWLRQALVGRAFPVEPLPHNAALLPGSKIAFVGGPFAALPAASQASMRAYLVAAAAQDPDRACGHLLEEMAPPQGGADLYALRLGFRQVVPFRDGGWSLKGDSDSLAEHLFVHWRLMAQHGYRPRRRILPFFRGLFLAAAVARQLAPRSDALAEGLEDLRLLDGMGRFAALMRPERLDDNLDRISAVAFELPKRLDAALTTLSSGEVKVRLRGGDRAAGERRRNRLTAAVAALGLLGAGAFWLPRLAAGAEWLEGVGALVFLAMGLLLLAIVRRLGR